MKTFLRLLFCLSAVHASLAVPLTLQWTNTSGGSWSNPTNWSPNFVPAPGDTANITNSGSYTVTATSTINIAILNLSQTLVLDNGMTLTATNAGNVLAGGILVDTNASLAGFVTVQPGGELLLTGSATKYIYTLDLNNHGTVFWNGGTIGVGGTPATVITNSGLWTMASDDNFYNGGGSGSQLAIFFNSGTLRKMGTGGTTFFNGANFLNQPGGLVDVLSGTLQLGGIGVNPLSGSFSSTLPGTLIINGGTWMDAGGTVSGTGTNLFNGTTLYLRTNFLANLKLAGGDLYLTNTFQQGGVITNLTLDGATLHGSNIVNNGTLTINSGSFPEQITVLPAGQLLFSTPASKLLYNGRILNQGTVTLADGALSVGGTPGTVISNGGLFQITGDYNINFGGNQTPVWTNTGVLRKTSGGGVAQLSGFNFVNLPGGLVESLSGSIRFTGGDDSRLGGTFNANLTNSILIGSGTWTDAGGHMTGTGTNSFTGGSFNLRTNTVPGLRLVGGDLYITGTNTFQQSGLITNLTLDGSVLHGTNFIAGVLTNNNSGMIDQLTILPAGELVLAGANKNLYNATILNQGTVLWTGGSVNVGGTLVSNGGLWQITGDVVASYGGGTVAVWTNSGTLKRSTSTFLASVGGFYFYNQTNGIVQADSGTLQLTSATTNQLGEFRLNGGTISAGGAVLPFGGGLFDGAGSIGNNAFTGGTLSPGQGGAGLISFPAGLNLGSNTIFSVDATGTTPGSQCDQLSVVGSVTLSNCTLQVTSLPFVAPGTTFTLIANDGTDPVIGNFNGLPENQLFSVGPQLFRIHYNGGTGNDVTLVRAPGPMTLTPVGLTNGNWFFTGEGTPAGLVYTIQASTNLLNWVNVGVLTGSGGGDILFIDTNSALYRYRFYRTTN